MGGAEHYCCYYVNNYHGLLNCVTSEVKYVDSGTWSTHVTTRDSLPGLYQLICVSYLDTDCSSMIQVTDFIITILSSTLSDIIILTILSSTLLNIIILTIFQSQHVVMTSWPGESLNPGPSEVNDYCALFLHI